MLEYFQSVLIRTSLPTDHAKKTYEKMEVWVHTFLTSALTVGEWAAPVLPLGRWRRRAYKISYCRVWTINSLQSVSLQKKYQSYSRQIQDHDVENWLRKRRLIAAESSHESSNLSCLCASRSNVRGSGNIDPLILDLGSTLRWVVSLTPQTFYSQG